MYIIFNGKLIEDNQPLIKAISQDFNYGYALFETIKFVNSKVFFLEEHLQRLEKSCKIININYVLNRDKILEYVQTLIINNNINSGSIKILYTKEQNFIISNRLNNYTKEKYEKGFAICFSNILKNKYSPICYIKSTNYLENILAKTDAEKKGYNEVIFLNTDNNITEGSYTNIFFIKDNVIYTPDTNCGLLSGIMRDKIISLIQNLKLKLKIGSFTKEDLLNSDEIFLTNSLMEIMPVSKLENLSFNLQSNKISQYLREEFDKIYYKHIKSTHQ